MQYQKLKGRTAFVTGAGSGIGRAAAIMLAQHGANVCLVDLKESRTEQVRQQISELEGNAGEAIVVEADVADPERMEAAVKAAVERWGRLDIVFANAGINGVLAPIEDLPVEEWDRTLSTNLKGTFLSVKYAIPHMKDNGGSVIITSSTNGNRVFANFGMTAYSTSKAGQVAFMKMAALELARYKIRVNAICPGSVKTNIGENTHPTPDLSKIKIPVKYPEGSQPLAHRSALPEQVAELVLFLASDDSSHITGTPIFIDGAESLL